MEIMDENSFIHPKMCTSIQSRMVLYQDFVEIKQFHALKNKEHITKHSLNILDSNHEVQECYIIVGNLWQG